MRGKDQNVEEQNEIKDARDVRRLRKREKRREGLGKRSILNRDKASRIFHGEKYKSGDREETKVAAWFPRSIGRYIYIHIGR